MWRVGRKVPRNVYRGDEPIAMVATPEIAAEIVDGMNRVYELERALADLLSSDRSGCACSYCERARKLLKKAR